jgi:hypothetical protein
MDARLQNERYERILKPLSRAGQLVLLVAKGLQTHCPTVSNAAASETMT